MKLYYAPGTCALACWIGLEWVGAECSVEKVNSASNEYRKINPLGLVPALDVNWERPLTQANAILQYIMRKYPQKDLGPNQSEKDIFEYNEISSFLTGDFHPAFWPYFAPRRYTLATDSGSITQVKESSYDRIDRVMIHLDSIIGERNHVYQNKKTLLDAYAYVMAKWSINLPKTWKDYPNVKRFMENMEKDTSVIKVEKLSKL